MREVKREAGEIPAQTSCCNLL